MPSLYGKIPPLKDKLLAYLTDISLCIPIPCFIAEHAIFVFLFYVPVFIYYVYLVYKHEGTFGTTTCKCQNVTLEGASLSLTSSLKLVFWLFGLVIPVSLIVSVFHLPPEATTLFNFLFILYVILNIMFIILDFNGRRALYEIFTKTITISK